MLNILDIGKYLTKLGSTAFAIYLLFHFVETIFTKVSFSEVDKNHSFTIIIFALCILSCTVIYFIFLGNGKNRTTFDKVTGAFLMVSTILFGLYILENRPDWKIKNQKKFFSVNIFGDSTKFPLDSANIQVVGEEAPTLVKNGIFKREINGSSDTSLHLIIFKDGYTPINDIVGNNSKIVLTKINKK